MVNVGENIFIIDPHYVIRKTNRRLRSRLNADNDRQLIGQICHRLFFHSETPCPECPVARSVAYRTPVEEEIPNNSHAKRLVKATPVLDDRQQVTSIIVNCLDDIESIGRSPAEDTPVAVPLPPSAEQSSRPEPYRVVLIDAEFSILLMSKSVQPFLRGSLSSGIGQNLFAALPCYSQAAVRQQIERFVADESCEAMTFNARADFYSEEWIAHTLIRLSMRGRTGAIVILSEPQQTEAAPEKLHLQKERIRLVSDFSSKIAHDFRNFLAPITADIEFLKSDMVNIGGVEGMFKAMEHVEKIQAKLNEMVEVLETLELLKPHRSAHITEINVGQWVNRAATVAMLGKPFPGNNIAVTVGEDLPFLYGIEATLDRSLIDIMRTLFVVGGEHCRLRLSAHFIHEKKGQFVIKIRANTPVGAPADFDALLNDFIGAKGRMEKTKANLLSAYSTILSHDGSMELFKLTEEETEVLIKLPRVAKI